MTDEECSAGQGSDGRPLHDAFRAAGARLIRVPVTAGSTAEDVRLRLEEWAPAP